jgi:hypothetical protein
MNIILMKVNNTNLQRMMMNYQMKMMINKNISKKIFILQNNRKWKNVNESFLNL